MRIDNEIKLDFKDVLIRPKRSTLNSRSEVSLERTFDFKKTPGAGFTGVPIIAANMDTVGTMSMARSFSKHHMLTALHKFYTEDELFDFYSADAACHFSFYTLGSSDADLEKFRRVNNRLKTKIPDYDMVLPRKVCIDVANGYSEKFNDFIKRFKEEFPYMVVMAGNVVTGEMTEELILSGADIVKIGIGPGSVCTTRKMTGVGYPQLSAIIECADAAHGLNAFICGDGGITNSGDVAKAFGAGADFIMCGGLFAGHKESEAIIQGATRKLRSNISITNPIMNPNSNTSTFIFSYIDENNERHAHTIERDISDLVTQKFSGTKTINDVELPDDFYEVTIPENAKIAFYGMSSEEAMNKYYNGKAKYRASEGKIVYIDYKGPVENTITEVLGGLRSACTYTGAKSLKQLSKCTTFIRVTQQLNESLGKS